MNASVLRTTKLRLKKQRVVPPSPGCIDPTGKPLLCLGAALVASHLQLKYGPKSAEYFARRIVQTSSSKAILEKAITSGFPASICQNAILKNDSYGNFNRKKGVLKYIDTILA